ncbi:MAG: PfkB family carbohydrate kinase [Planctomycetia bacterium]|nr:PfkB family carbohydrate kinase [Planctomycetia bacterium]
MKPILTAGLTPSWQHVLEFNSLTVNAVNRASASIWFSAGKSINAALAIHTLGGSVRTLFPGSGSNARKMRDELERLGLETHLLPTHSDVRVCTTLIDAATHTVTELVENGDSLTSSELSAWLNLFRYTATEVSMTVISGSLPKNTPVELYARMAECVPVGIPMIFDFRGEGLRKCLKFCPLIIKPNREELEQTVGRKLPQESDILAACHELNEQGAQWVIISDGPNMLYAVSMTETLRITPPTVIPAFGETLCPIGCGDALTGALALALSRNASMPDALSFALDAAARNLHQYTSCRF